MSNPARSNLDNLKEYIPGKSAQEVKLPGVIKLASNENPLGPSPKALEVLKNKLTEASLYPDQKCILLKAALAKKLGITGANLVIGNGSDEIMLMLVLAFLSAGEEVLISQNTFSVYESVSKIMGGRIKSVPQKNNKYDLESMAEALTEKTKLVWICNPNNPTGTISTKKELDNLIKQADPNTVVVIDEAYGEYVESRDYPNSLNYIREGKNVLALRTFSKLYGLAGLRVGYGIGKSSLIKYLNLVKLPFNVNKLAQSAALAALEDKNFIQKSLENNRTGKKYLSAEFKKMNLEFIETEANFMMLNLKQSADSVFMRLMKLGVIVRPLTSFGLAEAIRVTVGTPPQNKKFISALRQILR